MLKKTEVDSINSDLNLCACGCKQPTKIRNGKHNKFINGHQRRGKHNGKNGNGRWLVNGYWHIYKPDYFSAYDNGVVKEHIYIYQEFHKLCMLPWGDIHHIDETPEAEDANRIENLQGMTKSHHMILHRHDKKIKDMSGRVCKICGTDSPYTRKNGSPHWLGNEIDGFVCYNCNLKKRRKLKKLRLCGNLG